MRTTPRRALAGLGALAAAVAAALAFPVPAAACTCSGPGLAEGLKAGNVVAILTRVDTDPAAEAVTLRVERTLGGTLPAEVTGDLGVASPCDIAVPLGGITARVVERRDGAWRVARCSYVDVDEVLARAHARPEVTSDSPAAVLVLGDLAGSRLAALDRGGQVVAWDGLEGFGRAAAACPGGPLVAVGLTGWGAADRTELTVHDPATLRVRRTVRLPLDAGKRVWGLRCLDPRADEVDLLAGPDTEDGEGVFMTVTAAGVGITPVGVLRGGAAVRDGFLALVGEDGSDLVRLGRDGARRTTVARLSGPRRWSEPALSPDERTVAVRGHDSATGLPSVVTVDVASGETLADRAPPTVALGELAWAGPDRLMARRLGYYTSANPIQLLDRRLRPVGTTSAPTGLRLTAIGGVPVTFGEARVTAFPASGPPLPVDDLRLAGAAQVVALPGLPTGAFRPVARPRTPAPNTDVLGRTAASGIALALGAALAAAGLAVGLRRSRRRA